MFNVCFMCNMFMVILGLSNILYLFDGILHLLKFSTCELATCEFTVECYNFLHTYLQYLPCLATRLHLSQNA